MTLEELKKQKIKYVGFDYEDPKQCLEVVKRNGHALQYVKDQTEEICLEAVKQDGHALYYVKDQTEEICLEAVKQDRNALQFVKRKWYKVLIPIIIFIQKNKRV